MGQLAEGSGEHDEGGDLGARSHKPCRLTGMALVLLCPPEGEGALLFCQFCFSLFPSSIHKLRENVFQEHQTLKEKELETGPKASHGYGGKFGVEQDRMDKVSGRQRQLLTCTWLAESVLRPRTKPFWSFGGDEICQKESCVDLTHKVLPLLEALRILTAAGVWVTHREASSVIRTEALQPLDHRRGQDHCL